MNCHYLSFKLLVLFIITSLFFISCSAKPQLLKSLELKEIQFESNYTIEAKFKASANDIKETGYFVLKKTGNLIILRVGKNYLFPEKKLNFSLNDEINLNELLAFNEMGLQYNFKQQAVPLKKLMEIMIGQQKQLISNLNADYPEGFISLNGFRLPKKIIIKNDLIKLEIIIKKYIE